MYAVAFIIALVAAMLIAEQVVRIISSMKIDRLAETINATEQLASLDPTNTELAATLQVMNKNYEQAVKKYNGRCWFDSQYYVKEAMNALNAA